MQLKLKKKPHTQFNGENIFYLTLPARSMESFLVSILLSQFPFLDQCVKRGDDDQRQQGG